MSAFIVFGLLFLALVQAQIETADNSCYSSVDRACRVNTNKLSKSVGTFCDAKYGAIDALEQQLIDFSNAHISRSYEYLLMSTHFSNYIMNREGFAKLYRGLSDQKWNDAIDIIKHITKRGGRVSFSAPDLDRTNHEVYEIESLAKSLDIEKKIAEHTHEIHANATRKLSRYHDPELSSYLEKEFVHRQADTIRTLSGHISDLDKLLSDADYSLSLYLFDEYLQK